jgi:hypothetical protein
MVPSTVRVAAIKLFSLTTALGLLLPVLHSTLSAQIQVKLPEMTAQAGSELSIPLMIGGLGGEKVTAFEFVVSGDTSIVRFTGVEQGGTISEGLTMFANNRVRPYNAGRMKVVCASAEPIKGKGVLVKILATVGKKAGTCPLVLTNVVMNAGKPEARPINGLIRSKLQSMETPKALGDSLLHVR